MKELRIEIEELDPVTNRFEVTFMWKRARWVQSFETFEEALQKIEAVAWATIGPDDV